MGGERANSINYGDLAGATAEKGKNYLAAISSTAASSPQKQPPLTQRRPPVGGGVAVSTKDDVIAGVAGGRKL